MLEQEVVQLLVDILLCNAQVTPEHTPKGDNFCLIRLQTQNIKKKKQVMYFLSYNVSGADRLDVNHVGCAVIWNLPKDEDYLYKQVQGNIQLLLVL